MAADLVLGCASATATRVDAPTSADVETAPRGEASGGAARCRLEGGRLPIDDAVRDVALPGFVPPDPQWPDLPGRVRGLVYMVGDQPYGTAMQHNGLTTARGRDGGRIEYAFGVDGSSPFAVYFQAEHEGFNLLRGWRVELPAGGHFTADAAMFHAATPNPWGLSRRAHLVDVEVNGGAGGRGIHFVVTSASVVDGGGEAPCETEALLTAAHDDFVHVVGDTFRGARAGFAARARSVSGVQWADGVEETFAILPTYVSTTRALEVFFDWAYALRGQGPPRHATQVCPSCPPGAPCVRCDEHVLQPGVTVALGVRARAFYTIALDGRVIARAIGDPLVSDVDPLPTHTEWDEPPLRP